MRGSHVFRRLNVFAVLYGLSPRVRGSPLAILCVCIRLTLTVYPRECGAANGRYVAVGLETLTVYPRECGAATCSYLRFLLLSQHGLSPRVRGSLILGEATQPMAGAGLSPRVRGSPRQRLKSSSERVFGLSPRVRGSPATASARTCEDGIGLSPRVRGSLARKIIKLAVEGYIPRVRGSRAVDRAFHSLARSIPASAGQPTRRSA